MKTGQIRIEKSNKRIQIFSPDEEGEFSLTAKPATNSDIFQLSKKELAELIDISIDIKAFSS